MKLVGFRDGGRDRLGLVEGETVIDLAAVDARAPTDLGIYLAAGGQLGDLAEIGRRATAAHRRPLDGITFGLPVATPGKIICLGLNYLDHVKEGPYDRPDYPTLFMRGLSSLTAHRQAIVRPLVSDKLDFEAELVAVVGRRAKHVAIEDAHGVIAGYSCFNDGTLRDYQRRTVQWTVGKNFDSTGGFGPFFVTSDELPAGAAGLKIESRLNGEVMQSSNTDNMMFTVADTIALITEAITLEPGDLLVMGTPSGVGYARKPPVFMKAGDTIEIEIEGVGLLVNPVEDETAGRDRQAAE